MSEIPQQTIPPTQQVANPPADNQTSVFSSPVKNESKAQTNHSDQKHEAVAATAHTINQSPSAEAHNIEDKLEKYFDEYNVLDSKPSQKALLKVETPVRGLADVDSGKSDGSDSKDMDEEELYRYSQLSNKLNSALSKIEHSEFLNVKSPKRVGFDQTYKRFEMLEKKRKDDLQRKAKELQDEKLRELKVKPQVNEHSLHLQRNNQPIYARYQKQLQRKAKKLQDEREKKKKQEEEEYQQYLKVFEQKNQKPDKFRTSQQFYSELVRWKDNARTKAEEKKATQKQKQTEGATFKPIINQRSKKLLKKTDWQPIYERQPKPPKPIVQEYTFKPKINKKVQKP